MKTTIVQNLLMLYMGSVVIGAMLHIGMRPINTIECLIVSALMVPATAAFYWTLRLEWRRQ